MANSFFSRAAYTGLLLLVLPTVVLGKLGINDAKEVSLISGVSEISIQDSIPKPKPAEKKPEEVKPDTKKPDIKAVPKSRPQLKPRVVTDRIKIKPVKIPRPKILKLL